MKYIPLEHKQLVWLSIKTVSKDSAADLGEI